MLRLNMPEENEQPSPIDPLTIGELISLTEAADLSNLNRDFLRQLVAKNRLRAKRMGHYWYTTMAAIQEYKNTRHRGKRTIFDKTLEEE